MIELFKPNDPLRVVLGFIIFLFLSVPLFWIDFPVTSTDIVNYCIGNKLKDGFWLYKDIWDYTGMFSGLFYAFLNMFPSPEKAGLTFGLILWFLIGIITNFNFNRNEVFTQKNYITLFFLLISCFVSFIMPTVSPQLLSLFFLSLALNVVLKHFSNHLHDEDRILLGLWHGIASLFYFPCIIFLVLHLLFFAAFTKLKPSSYLLSIFGFIIPYFFIGIAYYTQGSLLDFVNRGILYYFQFNFRTGVGFENMILISLPLTIPIIFAFSTLFTQHHNNIQSTTKALMMLWFVCYFIIIFWSNFDAYNVCYLCIPFAYFCTYMFLILKKRILKIILSIAIPLFILVPFWFDNTNPYREKLEKPIIALNEGGKANNIRNKKVLVLGKDVKKYYHQKLSAKYFYWPMAQKQIKKINSFAGLTMIYISIMDDKPEIIYDEVHLMPKLCYHIPEIQKLYKTTDSKIYYLTK